jgi:tripartite-type tricarboxylate transporter receptor subunit TctC
MAIKHARAAVCAALLALGSAAAQAADGGAASYPNRPLRYLVAFAPGGINDIMARIVAEKLNQSWGQAVIVDNRPGAGGNVAAGILARTTPDGYTFMNISTAHAISQTLYTKLDYNLERDLTPVVVLGNSPLIMVVSAGLPAKNVSEFVSWARSNKLSYASGGVGVISHLSMEMFKVAAKIQGTHVPFKGVGPAVPALLSGEVHTMINAIPELLPFTKDGKLRVIASLTDKRHPMIPNVPTMVEQGYKDFVMGNWTGIVAPAKTPPAITHKLAAEITRILKAPDMTQKLSDMGVDAWGGTPEDFGKLIHAEVIRFGKAVKDSGAKAD